MMRRHHPREHGVGLSAVFIESSAETPHGQPVFVPHAHVPLPALTTPGFRISIRYSSICRLSFGCFCR